MYQRSKWQLAAARFQFGLMETSSSYKLSSCKSTAVRLPNIRLQPAAAGAILSPARLKRRVSRTISRTNGGLTTKEPRLPHIDSRLAKPAGLVSLLVLVTLGSAEAQTTSGPFAPIGAGLKPGDTIFVAASDGVEITGRLLRLSPTSLVVAVDDQQRELLSAEVTRIERRGDGLLNGTLFGVTIGGLIVAGGSGASCSPDCAKAVTLGTLLGAALGAPVGALFDALHAGRTLVYQSSPKPSVALTPLWTPDRSGVMLSVRY